MLFWIIRNRYELGVSSRNLMVYFKNYLHWLFRINYYRNILIHSGNRISSYKNFEIVGNEKDFIKCLNLNSGIYIQCSNGVKIHGSCIIAAGAKIISGNHNFHDFSAPSSPTNSVIVKKGCWIGANAIILPGVILEEGTIVGAGSVVTKSFSRSNIIIAGNPARIIKSIEKR